MDWTEHMTARIRELWAEGYSTAEIGRRMGVSKNAVVGKAHRLALPRRPSPIRAAADGAAEPGHPGPPRTRRRREVPRLTTFPPRSVQVRPAQVRPPGRRAPSPVPSGAGGTALARPPATSGGRRASAAGEPERMVQAPLAAPDRSGRHVQPCCWPIGEPGTRAFRFCGGDAHAGRPYCEAHARAAYVRARDRREDARQPQA